MLHDNRSCVPPQVMVPAVRKASFIADFMSDFVTQGRTAESVCSLST